MSRFFPRAEYAEEQRFPKAILATHVLYRGCQAGAGVGALVGSARIAYSSFSTRAAPVVLATHVSSTLPIPSLHNATGITQPHSLRNAAPILIRSVSTGALAGTALLTVGLYRTMAGREDIEWADRSWRLLANKGQVEVDDFSLLAAAGGALAGWRVLKGAAVWRGLVGGAGLGSCVGVLGYMGWRHGWNRGVWE